MISFFTPLMNLSGVLEKYTLVKLIGKSRLSEVYLAHHNKYSGYYAIKVFPKNVDQVAEAVFVKSIRILMTVKHVNILKFFEMIEDENYYAAVIEYALHRDSDQHIRKGIQTDNIEGVIKVFTQIAHTIYYLNRNEKLIYGNLCHQRLLIDERYNIKLYDFGKSINSGFNNWDLKAPISKSGITNSEKVYSPPEVLIFQQYSEKSDVWSLGVLLYYLIYGKVPFGILDSDDDETFKEKMNDSSVIFDYTNFVMMDDLKALINGMLRSDPHERLSIDQVIDYSLVKAQFEKMHGNKFLSLPSLLGPIKSSQSQDIKHIYQMKAQHNACLMNITKYRRMTMAKVMTPSQQTQKPAVLFA
ncbi:hypothetical protein TRFO_43106 [Tritrichomonas foetus]|uniref:Protein kinase domain-containing protein n=1 Tax=Tritrichomonas foetus TaxID=1144522 RepID=A0A1J4KSR6_9EUKA|nr:hypothetical protein TRFO_43106 [Tritrichomonas foetus]|eukprot:OHT14335.1 hypothetical protein TRFO_43106 [Tritrichomonas foetus]